MERASPPPVYSANDLDFRENCSLSPLLPEPQDILASCPPVASGQLMVPDNQNTSDIRFQHFDPTRPGKRGRPPTKPKAPVVTQVQQPHSDDRTFDLVAHVIIPDTAVKASRRGKGARKAPDPIVFGPIQVSVNLEWNNLLSILADLVECNDHRRLVVDSFGWRLSTPKAATRFPLKNATNLAALLRQVCGIKVGSGKYIIVDMKKPMHAIQNQLPWNDSGPSGRETWADEEQLSEEENPVKKVKLDDGLDEIVAMLQEKYTGKCDVHQDNPCFYHGPTKQHFDLSFRPRALQWAAKIRDGSLDDTRIPIGLGYFVAAHADKRRAPPVVQPDSTPVPTPMQAPSFPMMPFMMPPFMPFGYQPYPSQGWVPETPPCCKSQRRYSPSDSSSPVQAGPLISVAEFCTKYNLDDDIRACLNNLKWAVDYDPRRVKEAAYEKAGFTQVSWDRVLRAHKKFRKSQN